MRHLTFNEAQSRLKSNPLIFGDEQQIEAITLIDSIMSSKEDGTNECETCYGSGVTECEECNQDRTCPECGGVGTVVPISPKADPRELWLEFTSDLI